LTSEARPSRSDSLALLRSLCLLLATNPSLIRVCSTLGKGKGKGKALCESKSSAVPSAQQPTPSLAFCSRHARLLDSPIGYATVLTPLAVSTPTETSRPCPRPMLSPPTAPTPFYLPRRPDLRPSTRRPSNRTPFSTKAARTPPPEASEAGRPLSPDLDLAL
jgi:hypothetical protein